MTEPTARHKGKLKIYLGYAAGVGKTYQMLEEGQALRRKSVDVAIGYFESHGRKDTIAKTEGMEFVPRRMVVYRGAPFEEMDTNAILRRKPQVAIVDELAHTNVPGSERLKRWQDVHILLDAGIDVLTSLNVQHLESLNDQVFQMTGVRVRETLPDWVVDEADEIIMVDVTPRALRHRLERGAVYAPEKATKALESFFTEQNLNALRELTMRHAAHEIEERLSNLESISDPAAAQGEAPRPCGPKECILICLDERPSALVLIRRGRRVADYLRADCVAVHVAGEEVSAPAREAIEKHLGFARNLRIETHVLEGRDLAQTLVDYAHSRGVTQIFMGRSSSTGSPRLFRTSILNRVVRLARDVEITIVAERRR